MEKRKTGRPKKLTPSGDMIRARLRESLDKVLNGFVGAAEAGSAAHFKLICELLEEGDRKTRKDPARVLLEQWRREQRQKQKAKSAEKSSRDAEERPVEGEMGAFENELESVEG